MKSDRIPGRTRQTVYDFLACAIIIFFHFSNYLTYTRYDRIYPDILVVTAGLCAVALVLTVLLRVPSAIFRASVFSVLITFVLGDALFEFGTKDDISFRLIALSVMLLIALAVMFFLREHASTVLIGGFFAMLAATLGAGLFAGGDPEASDTKSAKNENLPLVVHIVLDEFAGLAGMSAQGPEGAAAARSAGEFFQGGGFRVFAGAYSRFFKTETSIAAALNFDLSADAHRHLSRRHYGYALNRNDYLKALSKQGYRINIYQSDYLDLCKSDDVVVATCSVYRPDNLSVAAIAGLPASERARLLFRMYYSSIAVIKLIRLAEIPVRQWLADKGMSVPPLRLWHGRVGPVAVAPTIERLTRDISAATGGDVFLAHLLTPHYPYVYGPDCRLRAPVSTWRLRYDENRKNTPESRRQSYVQYFQQIGCVRKRLSDIFQAMKRAGTYDRATIVIHGDHGSRIALNDPIKAVLSKLTPADFSDAYSTLFAVKAPGVDAGIDWRMIPLASLMSYAVKPDRETLKGNPNPTVVITGDSGAGMNVILPAFPGASVR